MAGCIIQMTEQWKIWIAELMGTFALVFVGAGAVIATTNYNAGFGMLGVAFAHGLVLMSMIFAVGRISGAHVNPAVTISMVATGKQKIESGIAYIIFQLIGATIAGFLLLFLFPQGIGSHLGSPDVAGGFGILHAVVLEAILTFFLVWTIFATAVDEKNSKAIAPLAIGLVLTFDILVGGNFTGAAMNPARAFGPAIASGYWATQIVYWIGPIAGGLIAAFLYQQLYLRPAR